MNINESSEGGVNPPATPACPATPSFPDDRWSTSTTLLIRIRPGSPTRELAWAEFHRRYAPIIAGFARNLGAQPQDIDDLIQDVMLSFYRVSPEFRYDPSKGRFRSFLKVCTHRALRRRAGKSLFFRGRPIDEIDAGAVEYDQAWTDLWEQENLRHALELTRERYNVNDERRRTFDAFQLYVLKELPAPEVAARLGISLDSVHHAKARVSRAVRQALTAVEEDRD